MVKVSQLPRPEGLIEVGTVLDIGPGLAPMGWYKPTRHICVEPCNERADALLAAGYEVWRTPGIHALRYLQPGTIEAIYMLDVIEHVDREEGVQMLELAELLRPKQIVVATPDGFWPQGGDHWMTHRSGWTPADFIGWKISYYDNGTPKPGFVAMT